MAKLRAAPFARHSRQSAVVARAVRRLRRLQVLRYARTCVALRSTADIPVPSWAKKRDGRPKTRKRDCTSRGQSTRRHDRRRVFACLLVAPVFLLEGNSVTARLILRRPLGYLWRLWSGSHFAQSIRPTTPRHACTTILSVTTTPAKPTLSTNCTGAGHNAGQLGRACVSAQAIGLPWPSGDAIGLARLTANEFDEEAGQRLIGAANDPKAALLPMGDLEGINVPDESFEEPTFKRLLGEQWSLTPDGWLR